MSSGLPKDCFDFGRGHIALNAALELLRSRITPVVGTETVPLSHAAGRILAQQLVSRRPVPAFDNAAVDGYAFAAASQPAQGPFSLPLAPGRAAAGHPVAEPVPAGRAIQVLTGAVMPPATDTVAMNEEVARDAGAVTFEQPLRPGTNRRRAGEDIKAGQTLFDPGLRLTPMHLGVAAELGRRELSVFRPLRVALASSGDELVEPGCPLPAGGVFDANRHMLLALLARLPVAVTDLGILADAGPAVERALLDAATRHHVVLTSGGASKGEEDHVVRTVERHGRLDFWQIAMKPGRPLAFGRLGEAVTIGLPGNPVAAAVCFMRLARPVIAGLAGAIWPEARAFLLPAAFDFQKKPGRTELLRGRLIPDDHRQGGVAAELIRRQGSGMLTSLTEAEGLIELAPETTRIAPGELVPFLTFAELGAV